MTPKYAKSLEDAFAAGIKAARTPRKGLSCRFDHKEGKPRDFFVNAFFAEEKKMKAEAEAYKLTPEYAAKLKADTEHWEGLGRALTSLCKGDICKRSHEPKAAEFHYKAAQRQLNEMIGM